MLHKNQLSIKHLICGQITSQKQIEVSNRREIMSRIIETKVNWEMRSLSPWNR